MLTLEQARANRLATDWDNLPIPVPWFLGRRNIKPTLDDLLPLLRLPAALADQARVLVGLLRLGPFDARSVYGFWAAQSIGDDLVIYKDDARATELLRVHTLRQQHVGPEEPSLGLADYVAPRETLAPDYIGAFALTVEISADLVARSPAIAGKSERPETIARVLAQRLAEAFAEYLHRQARHDWGYGADESLSREALIGRQYRGLRVASGSSALPDVSERVGLVRLLHAQEIGVSLDTSFGVKPEAAILGLYFAHPAAKPFRLGPVGPDQLEDYARRKGLDPGVAAGVLAIMGTTPEEPRA